MSWEITAERLNGAALFKAASTCPNPCTGLKKLGFWCNDDPCNLGKGDPPFKCECEEQAAAIVGIIVGCVALVCIGGFILGCLCIRPRTSVAVSHASTVVMSTPAYSYPGNGTPQYGQQGQPYGSPQNAQPHSHQQFYDAAPHGVNPTYAYNNAGYTEVPPPQPYQPQYGYRDVQPAQDPSSTAQELEGLPPAPNGRANPSTSNPIVKFT